jgi:anti-anti-sigma regulatory factor
MAFVLPASVTVRNAAEASAALSTALRGGERVVDASGVTENDSSLIAILLQARRADPSVRFTGLSPRAAQLAQLYGVGEFVLPAQEAHHTT